MITAVDTNILIDILEPDPVYGLASKEVLKRCLREGVVVACEMVWSEVAVVYDQEQEQLVDILRNMGVQFSPLTPDASLVASRCWARYLEKGSKRRRIAADFLIGGHALVQCHRLLTRDKGFYKDYFEGLRVESPL